MALRIRPFRTEDAGPLGDLISLTLWSSNRVDYGAVVLKRIQNDLSPRRLIDLSSTRSIFVAEDNGHLLGTASLQTSWVHAVFVLPACHRRGVGRHLMSHVENTVPRCGLSILRLYAIPSAVTFYSALGFDAQGSIDTVHYGRVTRMYKCVTESSLAS